MGNYERFVLRISILKIYFDVFDTFNFTVLNRIQLKKEVAVDPEMLGKVFENLLEIKDRRSKGAYYTLVKLFIYVPRKFN